MKRNAILVLLILLAFSSILLKGQEVDSLQVEPDLKKGIYLSFREFVANKPSMTDSFNIEVKQRVTNGWLGTNSHIPRSVGTGRKIVDIYGFCDGEKQYIFHNADFFEIEKRDGEYRFVGYGFDPYGAHLGYMFGAVGALITIAANGSIRDQRQEYVIDAQTGKITLINTYSSNLVIYRRAKKEKEDTLFISVNDSLFYNYVPNSCQVFSFSLSDEKVKVCFEEKEPCLFISRDSITTRYVKISALKGQDEITLEEVDINQGEFESIIPMRRQRSHYVNKEE